MCFDKGGIPYDPVSLFSVLCFGMMQGERSSRRLEESCRFDCRYWHLSGGCRPDHTTLSRYRKRLEPLLDELMLDLTQHARKVGLAFGHVLVVDGTKMPTSGSQWLRRKRECSEEEPDPGPSDPEARTMKTTHGEFITGYNLQAGVDAETGWVASASASVDANDTARMAEVLECTTRQSGLKPKSVVADKGYDSSTNLQAIEAVGADSYISTRRRLRSPFSPDENGVMRCKAGKAAKAYNVTLGGAPYVQYLVHGCKGCPFLSECGSGEAKRFRGRTQIQLKQGSSLEQFQANVERCSGEHGRGLLRIRGKTVERVFARLKRDYRTKRLHLKGKRGAFLEFAFACLTMNLQTLDKYLEAILCLLERLFGRKPAVPRLYFSRPSLTNQMAA
jgi:IS5 family transposase